MKEDHKFRSNCRVEIKEINHEDPNFWSKERITERGPYNLVEWSCENKINKLTRTLVFGRMVVHKERINVRRTYFCGMVVCK